MFDENNGRAGFGRGCHGQGQGLDHRHHHGGPGFPGGGPGGPFGWGGRRGGGGPMGMPFREGGGRARRGEARYIVLDILREGPKHGYEIIRALEERSGGQYTPSPGSIYPILQYLEELGLVRADQDGERRVFHLTDAGAADLQTRAAEVAAFWERFSGPKISAATETELGFLRDEYQELGRTAWGGLRNALLQDDVARLRAVRRALERCKNEIRAIIAGDAPAEEV